jgi:hypothetical protein
VFENRLSRLSLSSRSQHTAEARLCQTKTSGMRAGNRLVHGMPSGLSALPSMFGSVSGAGPANARSDFRMKRRQIRPDIQAFSLTHLVYSNDQALNDAETHPRNRASGATPSGRAHGRTSQRNPSTSSEGQSQAALAPYPRIYARSVRLFTDFCFSKRPQRILRLLRGLCLGYR